jgi:hypothetical protein
MTERYEDFRRPFDLDEAEEPERAPWDRDDDSYAAAPAYAAEDAVEDVEEEEAEPEPEPVAEAEAEPAYVAPVPEPEPEPGPEP